MADDRKRKISAVIACYRDAPAVPQMHERLTQVFTKLGVDYEIMFVNDASPDDAREVLAGIAAVDPKVVVINHTRNFGSQSAFTQRDGDRDRRRRRAARRRPPGSARADRAVPRAVARGVRRRLRRARQPRDDAVHAGRLQALLPRLPAGCLRPRAGRRRRLLADRPPRRRRAQRAPREQPLRPRAARLGRIPADGRALRAPRAAVRAQHELARSATSAGRGRRSSRSRTRPST